MNDRSPKQDSLREVAFVFLKLGLFSFGGPAAHIAMMEEELVRKRAWLSREKFLDLVAASHLIPGPNSTELAIHIGALRAGFPGLLAAGLCFIVPSFLMVLMLAMAYVRWGTLPEARGILAGIKPVIVAVVFHALWNLAGSALKSKQSALLCLASGAAYFAGVHEMLVLFAAGFIAAAMKKISFSRNLCSLVLIPAFPTSAAVSSALVPASPHLVFWIFFKIGSLLFGSGYVLLAFLRSELVTRFGWLTEAQLLDAVAAGQITPGPVFTTATFVGYLLTGWPGALAATAGIFLPAFIFVALSTPLIPRIRTSQAAGAFLDGVIAASLAMMGVVLFFLGKSCLTSPLSVFWALLSAFLLVKCRCQSSWLILVGAAAGIWRPF